MPHFVPLWYDAIMRLARLDLQAKIVLVLVAVILPTFLVITIAETQLTRPQLEEELRQVGIRTGETLASEIVLRHMLQSPKPSQAIDATLQELLYTQPNILRIDVIALDSAGNPSLVASNLEDDPTAAPTTYHLTNALTTERGLDDLGGAEVWVVRVPIEQKARDSKSPKKLLGNVEVQVSFKFVKRILDTLLRIKITAALLSVGILLFVLTYALRKTIENDRRLAKAESQNQELSDQLREAERQVMNTEKLAVMGQLTASFAHEIGTPLNAISGHLQLLSDELTNDQSMRRIEIIGSQISKIETIVKGFLQSTAKPASQRQLVDINRLIDQTLAIAGPRIESMGVEISRNLDHGLGPLRAVPIDIEQILLNLVNNSLDSLQAKPRAPRSRRLSVRSKAERVGDESFALIEVYDTGGGIKKTDLKKVLVPFFTTKPPGLGTGLGLTICSQIAKKYDGEIQVESKEGAWTQITVRLPYGRSREITT